MYQSNPTNETQEHYTTVIQKYLAQYRDMIANDAIFSETLSNLFIAPENYKEYSSLYLRQIAHWLEDSIFNQLTAELLLSCIHESTENTNTRPFGRYMGEGHELPVSSILSYFYDKIIDDHKEITLLTAFRGLNENHWLAFWKCMQLSSVESVHLPVTGLHSLSPDSWQIFWEGCQQSKVKSVNLARNQLGECMNDEAWEAFCNGLSKSNITSLNLEYNNLDKLSELQWDLFYKALTESKIENVQLMDDCVSYYAGAPHLGSSAEAREIESICDNNRDERIRRDERIKNSSLQDLCRYTLFNLPDACVTSENTKEGNVVHYFQYSNIDENNEKEIEKIELPEGVQDILLQKI